ncbi:hypothetical protein [Vibrio diazotrophicus]|uniref:hypothetical protein n=1 Tax=Vibrio diazotrophicus TaxID=685 RepID=UPI000C9DAA5C|nr:hypothetical protein [Vibrio diazotrophicus]PNH94096.1 hypothetical protein C1M59_05050 [Vibrio diazotrophicus]
MTIFQSATWSNLKTDITGDGSVSVASGLATIFSGLSSGSAQITKRIYPKPGQLVTVKVFANLSENSLARIRINYPTAGSPKNQVVVSEQGWRFYELSYLVPITHLPTDFITLTFGMNNEDFGTVQMLPPDITVENFEIPTPRCPAAFRLDINAGVITVNAYHIANGIESVTYDHATNPYLVIIQTEYTYPTNNNQVPLPFAQHAGGQNNQIKIHAQYDNSGLGRIYLVFYDGNGQPVDLTTLTGSFGVNVFTLV